MEEEISWCSYLQLLHVLLTGFSFLLPSRKPSNTSEDLQRERDQTIETLKAAMKYS